MILGKVPPVVIVVVVVVAAAAAAARRHELQMTHLRAVWICRAL